MATLMLTKVWLNRMDTGEALSAQSADRVRSHKKSGEVRTYAGGRQRSFTSEGLSGDFNVTLMNLSLTSTEILKSWIGYAVQLRDHRGQLFTGVFYTVGIKEAKDPAIYDVSLTLRFVS